MSHEPSIRSEDDLVWNAKDVEKSLLHNETPRPHQDDDVSRWTLLKGCAIYSILSFCFGALLALAIIPREQSRAENGSHWSIAFHTHRTRPYHAERYRLVQNTELRDAVAGSSRNVRFDGTFNRSSPYKGPPSPKVDALWHEITGCVMSISEQVYEHLNASFYAVKVPENLGGGRMAIFETIHQIHCVQALWQAAYPQYYTEQREFKDGHPENWYGHIDHCADMLRQKLMCDADTSLVTYNWMKGHSRPHPNFNVQHQCHDFKTVLQFARDHQIDKDNGDRIDVELLKPENEPIMEFEGEPPDDPDAIPLQSRG